MINADKSFLILIWVMSLAFASYGQEMEKVEQGYVLRNKYKFDFDKERWDLIQITKYDHASGFPEYDSIFEEQLKEVYTYQNNISLFDKNPQLISRFIYRKGQKKVCRFEFYGADGRKLYHLYNKGSNLNIEAVHPISENKFKEYHFNEFGSYGLVDTSRISTWENGNLKSISKNSIGDRGLGPAETRYDSLGRRTFHYEANWSYFTTYIKLNNSEVMKIDQAARGGMLEDMPSDTTIWATDENGRLLENKSIINYWNRMFYDNGMVKSEERKTFHRNDSLERYRYEYEGLFNKNMMGYLKRPMCNTLRKMNPQELKIVQGKLAKKYLGYDISLEHSFIEFREEKDTLWFLTAERAESIDFLLVRGRQVGIFPHKLAHLKEANVLAVGFKDVSDDDLKDIVILTKNNSSFETLAYLYEPKRETYIYSSPLTLKLKGVKNFEEVKHRLGD